MTEPWPDYRIFHEFLCSACAHRDHGKCERHCPYCSIKCGCACGRWAIPVGGPVDKG